MDLSQKVCKTNHQRQCGPCEDHAHDPLQLNSQQDFQEEPSNYRAHKQCGERACCDRRACQVPPALQALKLDLDGLCILQHGREWLFGKSAASVDDASKAACHDVEHPGNPGQQKDRCQCELDGVRHITDVHGHVEHEVLCRFAVAPPR